VLIHAALEIDPSAPEQDLAIRKQMRVHRHVGQRNDGLPIPELFTNCRGLLVAVVSIVGGAAPGRHVRSSFYWFGWIESLALMLALPISIIKRNATCGRISVHSDRRLIASLRFANFRNSGSADCGQWPRASNYLD
jgi:hypothetical protein